MSDPPPAAPPGAPGTSPRIQNMLMNVSQQTPEECSPSAGVFVNRTEAVNSVTPKVPPKSFFQSKRKLDLVSSSSPTPPQPQPKKVKKGPRSKEQAPQSGKSRTGWSIVLLKSEGKIQIKPMVQSSLGKKGLFTSAGPNSPQRPPWDSILDCEFQKNLNVAGTGAICEYLCTSNDNNRKKFRVDLIDPFMNSKDPFSQKTSEIVVNNPKVLGLYISLMSRSRNFFNHADKYDDRRRNFNRQVRGS